MSELIARVSALVYRQVAFDANIVGGVALGSDPLVGRGSMQGQAPVSPFTWRGMAQ